LRGLGSPDPDYYTSVPTSEVYLNRDTGVRTAIIYNPDPTDQIVSIFNQGAFVTNYTAPSRALLAVTR
jgi:hypothetical protein